MDKDWFFKTDEYICDLRVVGVLVRGGKLLVQCDRERSKYALKEKNGLFRMNCFRRG